MANVCLDFICGIGWRLWGIGVFLWRSIKSAAICGSVFTCLIAAVLYGLCYMKAGVQMTFLFGFSFLAMALTGGLCISLLSIVEYPFFRLCIGLYKAINRRYKWAAVNMIASATVAFFVVVICEGSTFSGFLSACVAAFFVALGAFNFTTAYMDANDSGTAGPKATTTTRNELVNSSTGIVSLPTASSDSVYFCTIGKCSHREDGFKGFLSYQMHTREMAYQRLKG